MKFFNFFKKSFLLLATFAIFLTFLMTAGFLKEAVTEAWIGLAISYLNFLGGTVVIVWGINKSDKQFYTAYFGGMFIRFSVMFILLFILLKYFHLGQLSLILSLLITYFSFLALEIWIINQSMQSKGNSE